MPKKIERRLKSTVLNDRALLLKKLIFLSIFIFLSVCSYSQKKAESFENSKQISSLSDQMNEQELTELFYTDIKTFKAVVDKRYKLALDQNDTNSVVINLLGLGRASTASGDFFEAEGFFFKALHYNSFSSNHKQNAEILRGLGNVYYLQLELIKAKNYFEKSIESAEHIKNEKLKWELTSAAKQVIGLVYTQLKMYDEAREIYFQLLKEPRSLRDKKTKANCHAHIGYAYLQEEKPRKALWHLEETLRSAPENAYMLIAETHGAISGAYLKLKEYSKSRVSRNKAIDFYRAAGYDGILYEHLIEIANINLLEKRYVDSTIILGEMLLNTAIESDNDHQLQGAYDILYRAYKEKGQLARALEMKERSELYTKKVDIVGKSEKVKIDEMRAQLLQEREKVMASRKQFNKTQQKSRTTFFIILLSFGLIFLVISLLYFRKLKKYRNERKQLLEQLAQSNHRKIPQGNGSDEMKEVEVELDENRVNELSSNKLNETDWKVIYELKSEPNSTNKEIASRIHMSYDGVVSSLRKMYKVFNVNVKKHHKIELLIKLYNISKNSRDHDFIST